MYNWQYFPSTSEFALWQCYKHSFSLSSIYNTPVILIKAVKFAALLTKLHLNLCLHINNINNYNINNIEYCEKD